MAGIPNDPFSEYITKKMTSSREEIDKRMNEGDGLDKHIRDVPKKPRDPQ